MRKTQIFIGFFILAFQAKAQNISDLSAIEKNAANETIESCKVDEKQKGCDAIPGEVLFSVLDRPPKIPESLCTYTPDAKKKKNATLSSESEVLLVAEIHTFDSAPATIGRSANEVLVTGEGTAVSTNFVIRDILKLATDNPNISENELADLSARLINTTAKTDDEKINLLAELSRRLYQNYNDKRNPFANNGSAIPEGRITLNNMYTAAFNNNTDQGGVCNDISTAVAQVAQKVFPNKDIFVVNNGTHFGVMMHDKDSKNTLISGSGRLITEVNDPLMDASFPTTNARILKLDGNVLKQIAVVDTESGTAIKKMIQGQTDPLTTGLDPSLFYANYKKVLEKERKTKTYELKAGAAQTSNSKMLILVGQSSKSTKNTDTTTALALAKQYMNTGNSNVIISFHSGLQRRIIRYQNPKLEIKASAGVEVDLSYGIRKDIDPNSALRIIEPATGNLQFNQTVDFKTKPSDVMKPSMNGRVQVVQAFGSMDEGQRQGALTDSHGYKSVMKSMKYMGFNLNQVKADVQVNAPINPNLASYGRVQYQGSNVMQNFKVEAGVNLINDGGNIITAYVGYVDNESLPGFKTKENISNQPSGGVIGGGYKNKKGFNLSADMQVNKGNNPIQANVRAVMTVDKKKKKKAPITGE